MRPLAFLFILLAPQLFSGCTKSTDNDELVGNWKAGDVFRGDPRGEAVSFVINDKAYVGSGYFGTLADYSDVFYKYDVDRGNWEPVKTPFPGGKIYGASAFVAGGKAYIVGGYDQTLKKAVDDVWEFDPVAETWTPKNKFTGGARHDAVAFTLDNKGYIATGALGNEKGALSDCWAYDQANDQWEAVGSVKGSKRSDAVAFVINGKAYICGGKSNLTALNDLQVYDPKEKNWVQLNKTTNATDESFDDDYDNIARWSAVVFNIDNKIYLTTGSNGGLLNNTWEYDAATDRWAEKTGFEGVGRTGAVAFTLRNRGFVLTGMSGSARFDNMFEFKPNDEQNDDDNY